MGGMLSMPISTKGRKTARKRSTKKSAKRSGSKARKGAKKIYKYPHGNHSHKTMKALKACK
jgi:hypothetical protein